MKSSESATPDSQLSIDNAFRPEGLTRQALPFLLVAVAAVISLALPPGPTSIPDTVISVILLTGSALCFFLPWRLLPSWADLIVPLLYSGSALALILAAGGSSAGVDLVILLPVVWTALYLQPWKSVVVVAAVVVVQFVITIVPTPVSDTVRDRKLVFIIAIGGLIAFSINEIRQRVARSNERREAVNVAMAHTISELEERTRESALLSELADMMQLCSTRSEAAEVMSHTAGKLFPEGGSVSLRDSITQLLETNSAWGGYPKDELPFSLNDCWALRRGQVYESKPGELICAHLKHGLEKRSLCQPLIAQGEIIGVLSVAFPPSASDSSTTASNDESIRRLALTVSEQIAISTANFQLNESLRNLSVRDPLTNLYNRRFMEETLDRELSSALRTHDPVSIIQIDVDNFKDFNDTFGHQVGDAVLRVVGEVLLRVFRNSDVPCRSGGEEFTVILPKCSVRDAESRAEALRVAIAEMELPFHRNEMAATAPTLSMGVATSPEHGSVAKILLRAADLALYEAKTAGRDRIVTATNSIRAVEDLPAGGVPPAKELRPEDAPSVLAIVTD